MVASAEATKQNHYILQLFNINFPVKNFGAFRLNEYSDGTATNIFSFTITTPILLSQQGGCAP